MTGSCSKLCVIIVTLFLPPLGVFLISDCSADFVINILLTILGYIPGLIHAFYLEFVYYSRRNAGPKHRPMSEDAPGVYSDWIQTGGRPFQDYGTVRV